MAEPWAVTLRCADLFVTVIGVSLAVSGWRDADYFSVGLGCFVACLGWRWFWQDRDD